MHMYSLMGSFSPVVHIGGAHILLHNIGESTESKDDAEGLGSWKVPKTGLMLHIPTSMEVSLPETYTSFVLFMIVNHS